MFWMMKLTPIAVISGASRGARRSGRYAKRSITTPARPIRDAVTAKTITSAITSSGMLSIAPLLPSSV